MLWHFSGHPACKKFCAILNREVFLLKQMEVESQKRTNSNSLKAIMPHCTQILHPCITWTLFSLFLIALVLRVWVQILSCPCIFFCSVNSLQFRLARNTAIKMVFVFLANSPNGVDVTVVWDDRCWTCSLRENLCCVILKSFLFLETDGWRESQGNQLIHLCFPVK